MTTRPPRPLALVVLGLVSPLATAGTARAADGDVRVTDFPQGGDPKAPGGEYRVTELEATRTEHLHDSSVTYLGLGPVLSLVGGLQPATGVGLEGSLMHYDNGKLPSIGLGTFLQLQLLDGKWLRADAGGQAAFGPLGVELGLGFRQGDDTFASTVSLHAAEFLSLGYLSISVHESPALIAFPSRVPSFGFDTSFMFSIKVPIAIAGHDRTDLVPSLGGRL